MTRSPLFHLAALASITTTTTTLTSAQFHANKPLGSCVDVDCPPAAPNDSTTLAQCRVANRTHSLIGLETFPSAITQHGNLTWTLGVEAFDGAEPGDRSARVVEKAFYLGTPEFLGRSDDDDDDAGGSYLGCAVFIHGNGMTRPERNESWACAEVVGAECQASLVDDAVELVLGGVGNNGTEDVEVACRRVQEGLRGRVSAGCGRVVVGDDGGEKKEGEEDGWREVHAVPLTGPTAPRPPLPAFNESSNCHPTLPKSNDLRFVYGYNDTGTAQSASTIQMLYAVNLVLTVFWSPAAAAAGGGGNGTVGGALRVPDTHLSCLWLVEMNNEQADMLEPGSGVGLGGSGIFAGMVAVVISLMLMV